MALNPTAFTERVVSEFPHHHRPRVSRAPLRVTIDVDPVGLL